MLHWDSDDRRAAAADRQRLIAVIGFQRLRQRFSTSGCSEHWRHFRVDAVHY